MKNKFDDIIVSKLYELYKTYELFIWKNELNRKLVVIMGNNMMLSFYLYEDNELIDELDLKFDNKEESLYQTICIKLFILFLGNVFIYKNDNIYYNIKHKPYLAVIIENNKLNSIINLLVDNQNNEIIDQNNIIIKNKINIKYKKYNKQFINELDKRITLSKEMLRGW